MNIPFSDERFTAERMHYHASLVTPETHSALGQEFQKHRLWGDLTTHQERSNYVYLCLISLNATRELKARGTAIPEDFDVLLVPMINRMFPVLQLQNITSFLNAFLRRVEDNPGLDRALPAVYRPVIDSFVYEYLPDMNAEPTVAVVAENGPETAPESTQEEEEESLLTEGEDEHPVVDYDDDDLPDLDEDDKDWINGIDANALTLGDILGAEEEEEELTDNKDVL